MAFERIRMGKDFIFTTIVEDQDGKEIQRWKVMKNDFPKTVRILSKQFGLNVKVIDKKVSKDLDWAF